MKISIYNNYGAKNSPKVLEAVAHGLQSLGHLVNFHDDSADMAVIWSQLWAGRMLPNKQIFLNFRSQHKPVLVVEVGTIFRGVTWKIMHNGENTLPLKNCTSERFEKFGLRMLPWRAQGNHVLIACQRTESQQWSNQPSMDQWLDRTVSEIRKYTDLTIKIRPHPRQRLSTIPNGCVLDLPTHVSTTYDSYNYEQSLDNCWCVINHNSGPGVQSVLNGVPVIVDKSSPAAQVGATDLSFIKSPLMPDRTQWAYNLAHTEWTVDEIAQSMPFDFLSQYR